MTCDNYQIAFEQQMAGVSAAVADAQLAAHIAGCATCAAYVRVSREVSESVASTLTLSPAPLGLEAMTAHIERERRRTMRGFVVGPLIFAAGLTLARLADSSPTAGLFVGTAISAALFAAFVVYGGRRRLAQLAALERATGGELVAGLRRDLTREIRQLRPARYVLPICVVATYADLLLWPRMPDFFELAVAAGMLVLVPYLVLRHRRLVRERDLLGE